MQLTDQQQHAVFSTLAWLDDYRKLPSRSNIFVFTGYAGTGKTTVLKFIADHVGHDRVVFATPTGKAMEVLRRKVPDNCRTYTLHSLLRSFRPNSALLKLEDDILVANDGPEREKLVAEYDRVRKKTDLLFGHKESDLMAEDTLVVDEASMLSPEFMETLEQLHNPVILVGDPAQLPPVKAASVLRSLHPNVTLSEVLRQAEGSDIAAICEQVRLGQFTPTYEPFNLERILENGGIGSACLVFRNKTRRLINKLARQHLGRFEPSPMAGDKLICTRNMKRGGEYFYVNGEEFICQKDTGLRWEMHDYSVAAAVSQAGNVHECDIYFQECVENYGPASPQYVLTDREINRFQPLVVDYAYAITVHKAQGSQWKRVFVIDDQAEMQGDAGYRSWLYTAVSRAVDEVVFMRHPEAGVSMFV